MNKDTNDISIDELMLKISDNLSKQTSLTRDIVLNQQATHSDIEKQLQLAAKDSLDIQMSKELTKNASERLAVYKQTMRLYGQLVDLESMTIDLFRQLTEQIGNNTNQNKKLQIKAEMNIRITDLADKGLISGRTSRALFRAGIVTLGDIVNRDTPLRYIRGFGERSYAEVTELLKQYGLE